MRIGRDTRWLSLLAIALTALALGACGDDDDDGGSAGTSEDAATDQAAGGGGEAQDAAETEDLPSGVEGSTLRVIAVEDLAKPGIRFSEKRATVDAGPVTLTMRSPKASQLPHAIEVEGSGVEKAGKVVKAGGTSTVTANLKPGKYVFYCPVGDHRKLGMKGALTVR